MLNNDVRLSIHHIGAREAVQSFPRLERFESDMVHVLYDADDECLPRVQQMFGDSESELHVLPYCFAGNSGPSIFNINYDLSTSSLLNLNSEYEGYYIGSRDFDWLVSETLKTVEKRPITTVTLDDVFVRGDGQLQPPDFLSLDTQGSEYDILLGGVETLRRHVVALELEVEFHPLYQDQKLFGDICAFLSEQGFHFVRFRDIFSEMSPFRAEVGLRGSGFQMSGDALFLKKTTNICSDDQLNRSVMLRKLAFISIVLNQFEYGLQCLMAAKGLGTTRPSNQESRGHRTEALYEIFLSELLRLIPSNQPTTRPTFASTFSFGDNQRFFTTTPSSKPWSEPFLRPFRSILGPIQYAKNLLALRSRNDKIAKTRSPVERLLAKYGLNEQALILGRKRFHQTMH